MQAQVLNQLKKVQGESDDGLDALLAGAQLLARANLKPMKHFDIHGPSSPRR
jgi:hypothetical protein